MGESASDWGRGAADAVLLAAHGLTHWTNLSADGFTLYPHAAGLSRRRTIVGLFILRRVLRRHFTDRVSTLTIVALLFERISTTTRPTTRPTATLTRLRCSRR
jgi:hypothetical protein